MRKTLSFSTIQSNHTLRRIKHAFCCAIVSLVALYISFPKEKELRYHQSSNKDFWKDYYEKETSKEKIHYLYSGSSTAGFNTIRGKTLEFFTASTIRETIANQFINTHSTIIGEFIGNTMGFSAFHSIKYILLYPWTTLLSMQQTKKFPDYLKNEIDASNYKLLYSIWQQKGLLGLYPGFKYGYARTLIIGSLSYPSINGCTRWIENYTPKLHFELPIHLLAGGCVGIGVGCTLALLTIQLDTKRVLAQLNQDSESPSNSFLNLKYPFRTDLIKNFKKEKISPLKWSMPDTKKGLAKYLTLSRTGINKNIIKKTAATSAIYSFVTGTGYTLVRHVLNETKKGS